MTPQEAYNKGLDDAENVAIQKLENTINGVEVAPFNNPKMEELRQRILELKNIPSKTVVISSEELDRRRIIKVFSSILKGTPSKLKIQDDELEQVRQHIQNVIMKLYELTPKRTKFSIIMRKFLKDNHYKGLTFEEDDVK